MKLQISLLGFNFIEIEFEPTTTLKEIINLVKPSFPDLLDEESLQINNRIFTINDFSKSLNELNINMDTIKFEIKKRTLSCIPFCFAGEIQDAKPNLDSDSNPIPKTLSFVAREHSQNPWSIADLWEILNYLNKMREDKLADSSKIDSLYHFLKLLYLTAPIEKFEPNPICIGDAKKMREELYSHNPSLQRFQTLLSQFKNLSINLYFFPPHTASLFFQALKTNNTIKNLDVCWDSRYKNLENEFCEYLKNNTSLLRLDFNCCNDDILQIVAEGLKKNRTLQELCLSEIKNKNDVAKILAVDSPLQSLIFNFELFEKDRDAIQEIAKALQSNTSLRFLTIKMHFDCLPLIASALQKNTTLTKITLPVRNNLINMNKLEETKNTLVEISKNNATLQIIIDRSYHNEPDLIDKNLEAKMNFHEDSRKFYAQRCIEILPTEPKTLPPILKISGHIEFKANKIQIKLSLLNDFVIAFYNITVTQFITLERIMDAIRKEAGPFSTFLLGATIQVNDQIFTEPNFSKLLPELNIEKIDTINIKIKKVTVPCILYSLTRELNAPKPNSSPDSNLIPKTLFLVANRQREKPWYTGYLWEIRYYLNQMLEKKPEISSHAYALYNFSRLLFLSAPIEKILYHDLIFSGNLREELIRPHSNIQVIKTILSQCNSLIINELSFPPDKANLFFEALKTNNTIQRLELTWNPQLKKSANEFCKALHGNTSLLQLNFFCYSLFSDSQYDNSDDMLQIIAEGLKNNTSLRELKVMGIKNKNEAAKIVAIDSFSITSLSLSFDEEDKDVIQDVSKLSEALQNNTSLRSLIITIHPNYLPYLMTALQKNSMLTEIIIYLKNWNIDDFNKWKEIKNILVKILEKNTTLRIKIYNDYEDKPLIDKNINNKMNFNEEARKIYTENCIDTLLTQSENLPAILKIPGHFEFEQVPKSVILKIMCESQLLINTLCIMIMEYLPPFPSFTLTSAPQQFFVPQKNLKRKHSSLDDKNDHSDSSVLKKINNSH